MPEPHPRWQLHRTPSPSESGFSVTISMDDAARDVVKLDAFKAGSLFQNFPIIPETYLAKPDKFGLYRYISKEEIGQSHLRYHFCRSKTPDEIATPFRSYSVLEPYDWLPVLTFLEFTQDRGAPLSQNTTDTSGRQGTVIIPRWLVRRGYVHGQRINTTILIREYLSDVPYPDGLLATDEPLGTEVSWNLVGSSGTTGRCLHDEVKVPSQGGPYAVIDNAGNPESGTATGQKDAQYFSRTNAARWQDFETNQVKFEQGQFHRIQYIYIAPVMPEASILAS